MTPYNMELTEEFRKEILEGHDHYIKAFYALKELTGDSTAAAAIMIADGLNDVSDDIGGGSVNINDTLQRLQYTVSNMSRAVDKLNVLIERLDVTVSNTLK